MWTKSAVDDILKTYLDDKARALHLALEIHDAESEISAFLARLPAYEAGPRAQVITGMPHGTGVGNPTEQVALKLASGWEPQELKVMRAKLADKLTEYNALTTRLSYVEAWLLVLNDRERWVVLHQYMQQDYWRDILEDYQKAFGAFASKDTLKRLRAKAFKKIYAVAQIKS